MSICVETMFVAPFGSEKTNPNVWLVPLPELGVTDTTVGGVGVTVPDPAVQVPRCDQPLSKDAFCASAYMFFGPAKAALNVITRFTVSVLPDVITDDAPVSNEHWLFCCVPATPMVEAEPNEPASFANWIEFEARE